MREIVIIGGGLAGAAAATRLAEAGRDVLVLERTIGPHDKVCGEFLSFEALDTLRSLGLDLDALGAVPIRSVTLERLGRRTRAPLGFTGLSLSRRRLDEALLARASEAGAEVRRGIRVGGVTSWGQGWAVETGEAPIPAGTVLLATGKHDLRGRGRPAGPQPDLIGLKSYWHLPAPERLAGQVGLYLFPGGYAGLQPSDGGRANLCLVIRDRAFATLGRRWDALLSHLYTVCPGLREALAGAEPCAPRPLAIAHIPYGLVQHQSDGLWRLGDQAAVIPSFTGEGMSIALLSAVRAAEALLSGDSASAFQARLARDLRAQVRRSTLLSRVLVEPWAQAPIGRLATPSLMGHVLRATRIDPAVQVAPA